MVGAAVAAAGGRVVVRAGLQVGGGQVVVATLRRVVVGAGKVVVLAIRLALSTYWEGRWSGKAWGRREGASGRDRRSRSTRASQNNCRSLHPRAGVNTSDDSVGVCDGEST